MKILFIFMILLFANGCIEFGEDGETFPETMTEEEHRQELIRINTNDVSKRCHVNEEGKTVCSLDGFCDYDDRKQKLLCKGTRKYLEKKQRK